MSQAIAVRIGTNGVITVYGDKNAALSDAAASDHVFEVLNCRKQQLLTLSGAGSPYTLTDSTINEPSVRHVVKLK
jgi:hypothetical protein